MFSNMMFFIFLLFKASPFLVIGELVWGVMSTLPSTLISVLGIKYVIDIAASGNRLYRIYYVVLGTAALLFFSKLICYLYREFFWNVQKEKAYFNLNRQLYEKAKSLDLESYDNPDFYNEFILTIESSSDNIQNLLGLVRRYFANVVSLLTVSSILLTIDAFCLVIILGTILIFLPISHIISNLQVERRIENTKYHRRSDYFQRIFYLQDYAKEVRMNNIHPLLIDRYNDAADDVIANQKKYWTKIPRLYFIQEMGVQIVGFMFILPLYLGYLVLIKKTITPGDFVASFNSAYSIAISINFLTVWGVAQFGERAKLIEKYRGFLKSDSKIKDGNEQARVGKPKEIKIENLSFTYRKSKRAVLHDFSLSFESGRVYGLLGKNGAGKSTLLYLMSGLLTPKNGKVVFHNTDVRRRLPVTLQDMFLVPEEFELPSVSLVSYVELNSPFYPRFSKEEMIKYLHYFEMDIDIDLGSLSMGQKKKVFMSFALATNTSLLLMDEPTNGLDIPGKSQFRKFIASGMSDDKTIVISTHQVRDIDKVLDHVLIMDDSRVLLDESTSNICDKLFFVESDNRELAKNALFAIPTIQGNYLILPNEEQEESELNLELLFNATLAAPEEIARLFHTQK